MIVTRDETITKWLDPNSAALSRDALAKIVYSRLFDWCVFSLKKINDILELWYDLNFILMINMFNVTFLRLVDKINNSIGQDPDSKFLIGVLDIYGFESFKTNRCSSGMPFSWIRNKDFR